jgi:hypothetical protein
VWGASVLWVASALLTAFTAYAQIVAEMRANYNDIALRLQRIEIVLRIDPLTKDVPMRTVAAEERGR